MASAMRSTTSVAAQRTSDRPKYKDGEDSRVSDADRAEASHLHRRAATSRKPERDDGIEDAVGPDADDRDEQDRLERVVHRLRVSRKAQRNCSDADHDHQGDDHVSRAHVERYERIAKHQQPVPRKKEEDHADVGRHLTCDASGVKLRRDDDVEGQRQQSQGEVAMAAVRVSSPGQGCAQRQCCERGHDGEREHDEEVRHCRQNSLHDDFSRTSGLSFG